MSAQTLDYLANELRACLDDVPPETSSLDVLRLVIANLARNSAEVAFFRVRVESLAYEQAEALSTTVIEDNTASITDEIRRFGGSEEEASHLVTGWLAAYRARLNDLLAAPRQGGSA